MMVQTEITLIRKPAAPTFIGSKGGVYDNPIVKIKDVIHKIGKELTLIFGVYASDDDDEQSFNQFELKFDHNSVQPLPDPKTGQILEWGYPNYNYVMENLIEFTKSCYPMLISEEGIAWLLNSTRVSVPNRLNENAMFNWQFKSLNGAA